MGLFTNRIDKDSLKPGDHIYSWRAAHIYAHHGIYIGDDKVIHFTRNGQEVGTGTNLDCPSASSMPVNPQEPCLICATLQEGDHDHGVILSCLNCFLASGNLYRYENSVSHTFFLTSMRVGTCTLADSDPSDVIIRRAKYLLDKGFGSYDLTWNNCEHFALYCKTERLVLGRRTVRQSDQAASTAASSPVALSFIVMRRFIPTTLWEVADQYCSGKYAADISKMDTVKLPVENLAEILQGVEPTNLATPMQDGQRILVAPMQDGQQISAASMQDGQSISATPKQDGQPISATPMQDGQSEGAFDGFDCMFPPGG